MPAEVHYDDPLIDLLAEQGVLMPEVVQEILEHQERTSQSVRSLLPQMDILSEDDLLDIIAGSLSTTVINLPGCPMNVENLTATIVHFLTFGRLPATDSMGRPLFAKAMMSMP